MESNTPEEEVPQGDIAPESTVPEAGSEQTTDQAAEAAAEEHESENQSAEVQPGVNNSGDNPVIFEETEIDEVNLNQAGRDVINNYINNYSKIPKEKRFSCPNCGEPVEVKRFGKQVCKNPECKKTFIIKDGDQDRNIILYKTLLPDEARKYDKIIAQINNSLQDRDYVAAYQYCRKAEELAPGEVATWVYFALVEFLFEIKKKEGRKPTAVIIKSVRSHIEKCKIHGMTAEECLPLEKDIATRLFKIEKSRINSVQAQYRDSSNNPRWSKFNFNYLQGLLESFDICYSLNRDTLFLEGYIEELSKNHKWLFRSAEDKLVNNPASGFNAEKKWYSLVEKMKTKKPDYLPPEIAEERFTIKKIHYLKINAVTAKPD